MAGDVLPYTGDDDRLKFVIARVEALKHRYEGRDGRATQVRAVRAGNFDALNADLFNDEWPRPVVANLIDTMARDFMANLAPLPSFSCSSTSMMSDAAKKFADTRTKIVNHYVQFSNLSAQMPAGADGFNSYGLFAIESAPDLGAKFPRMRVLDGATVYPVWDTFTKRTVAAAEITHVDALDLEASYPDVAALRANKPTICQGDKYELVRYVDDEMIVVYLPDADNRVLHRAKNPIGRCFITAVPRPSGEGTWSGGFRGAYDDLIWPQLARNKFQMLAMEAADKAVRAPIVVPMDTSDVPMGPDAILRTNNPQGIGRVKIDVPQSAFQSMQWLERDMQMGGMTTQARMGQQGTGWTTGKGLEQLGDLWSGQLAADQEMIRFGLQQAIGLCFAWDEKLWPNLRKKIRGADNGVPFEVSYTPSKDIKGDHTVDITYGFTLGMDANRALVYLLQVLGAGLISKDTAARALPAPVNAVEELKKVDLELVRGSVLQAVAGMAASIPQLAASGMDPSQTVRDMAKIAELMQKGEPIEQVVEKVLAPPEPPPAPMSPDAATLSGEPGVPGAGGEPDQVFPGAPPTAEGGRPPLSMLFAGVTASGKPNLQSGVSRMVPAR